MASENFFKSNIITGLAAGVGATLLAPVLLPVLANIAKPLTKAAIKAGITTYEKGLEYFAEFGEVMDDLVAEAKSEMGAGAAPATAVAAQTPETASANQAPAAVPPTQSKQADKTVQGAATPSPSGSVETGQADQAPPPAKNT